ncbi:HobA family DNA replication regulator [Campylobacter sp. RM12647]|uniref:HobA family DNA replication regulator n=1 Tax=Campylobacter sp. RM12647 TaxID=2735737 RepID=UPI001E17A69C|nr:hypothetical protein [Campylobacter sp. RM12647]
MQDFLSFVKDFIQKKGMLYSWLDSERFKISPLLSSRLSYLLDGKTFIVICDDERTWFEEYFLSLVNAKSARPLLPFFSLKGFKLDNYDKNEDLLDDVLDLAYPNGYIYIYFGKDSSKMAKLAKNRKDSLMFILDEEYDNSFCLKSSDEHLDIKLITIAQLINACLDAIIFAKVKI